MDRVERLETVVVEIHHLSVASEQVGILLLVKSGLDRESGFLDVIQFNNRCTTGHRVLTSEFVFLTRPTNALKKLWVSTVPVIGGDTSVEVSVGTE